jgi:hypothetical protein
MRAKKLLVLIFALSAVCSATAQSSNRGSTEVTIKGKKITINYGRPSVRDRDLTNLAPVGMVWRLGMNQATEIESTGDLVVGGTNVAAGKYSLWAKKTGPTTWILAFHPKTAIWGAPPQTTGFIAEMPLKQETSADASEQLTITLSQQSGKGAVKIHWGKSVLSGAFDVK